MTGELFGWDASNHDWARGPMDLVRAHREGIDLMTHKATESGGPHLYEDPFLPQWYARAWTSGIPVLGTYHAQHPGYPLVQADAWFAYTDAVCKAWRSHRCWIWQIDAEPFEGDHAPSIADINAIGARLVAHGVDPRKIVAYAPEWVYGNEVQGLHYPVWASNYGPNPSGPFRAAAPGASDPRWAPYGHKSPLILQYSSRATIAGQQPADANVVRAGTVADLYAMFGVHPQLPTPAPVPHGILRRPWPSYVHAGQWIGAGSHTGRTAAEKADVRAIQERLAQIGFSHVRPTTVIDPATIRAVSIFQKKHVRTSYHAGRVNWTTWVRLFTY